MDNSTRYSYNRFGKKGQRVGQAVADILSKEQPTYLVEEIQEGMQEKIREEFEKTIEKGNKLFNEKYYVLLYYKKDLIQFGISNVMKIGFLIGDKIKDFDPIELTSKHSNWDKTLYEIDPKGYHKILWHLPDWERIKMIAKKPHLYHPDLLRWIIECFDGKFSQPSLLTA